MEGELPVQNMLIGSVAPDAIGTSKRRIKSVSPAAEVLEHLYTQGGNPTELKSIP
jgi:hypothetical protein